MRYTLPKTSKKFSINKDIYFLYDTELLLLGIDPREIHMYVCTTYMCLYSGVYRCHIHDHQNPEITQISFSGFMEKQIVTNPSTGVLLSNAKE